MSRTDYSHCRTDLELGESFRLIILSTGSLHSYGLSRAFELASQAGFPAVEVLIDQRWDTRQPEYLNRLQEQTGVGIASLHSPFVAGVPGWENDQLCRLKRTVKLAREVGARHVVAHLPYRFAFVWLNASWRSDSRLGLPIPAPGRDAAYTRFLQTELPALEAESGVTIVVENLPCRRLGPFRYNGYRLNTLDRWGQLPHLNLDTTHLATWGYDLLPTYERHKERIRHIHLSNYNGKEHRLLWDGCLALGEFLDRLALDQFDGLLCVELDPEPLAAATEKGALDNLRLCYEFCASRLPGSR